MTQEQFKTLKVIGHYVGMLLLVACISLVFIKDNGLFILVGIVAYWVINYGIIRGFIENKYVSKM